MLAIISLTNLQATAFLSKILNTIFQETLGGLVKVKNIARTEIFRDHLATLI